MRFLIGLFVSLATKRPKMTIAAILLLAVVCGAHATRGLRFDTDQDNLISPKQEYFQRYKEFLTEFGDWEYIYLVIKAGDNKDEARHLVDEFVARLKTRPDLFAEVTGKLDISGLTGNGLLLMSPNEFAAFDATARAFAPEFKSFLDIKDAADWYAWLAHFLSNKASGMDAGLMERFWPLFQDGMAAPFDGQAAKRFNPSAILSVAGGRFVDPDGYLFSQTGKLLLAQVLPRKDYTRMDIIAEPLAFLRAQITELQTIHPDIEFGLTGRPVLQNDEAASTGVDSTWASIGSFALVTLLFVFFVKDLRLTLMSLFAMLVAIVITAGLVAATIGHLNLLTVVFAVILVGMGTDFGIQFLLHYEVLKESGATIHEAVSKSLNANGTAILVGAALSAIGFATSAFTEFRGLQELGVIVGAGIVICCLLQLTLFPALIVVFDDTKKIHHDILSRFRPITNLCAKLSTRPKTVLATSLLVAIICTPAIFKTRFDFDLLKLQDPTQESVRYEKLLDSEPDTATWFLAAMTKDKMELKKWREALSRVATVSRTDSLLDVVPDADATRVRAVRNLNALIASQTPQIATAPYEVLFMRLKTAFESLAGKAFSSGDADAYTALKAQTVKIDSLNDAWQNSPFFSPPEEAAFMRTIASLQRTVKTLLAASTADKDALPTMLQKRYLSPNGNYSIAIYPRKDVWRWNHLESFITTVRAVIPDVTGAPVTTYESAVRMNDGFKRIAVCAAAVIFILLVAAFRELRSPLVIFGNLALTFWLLFAFMVLADIPINLANFFAMPMLIGSAVNYGVFFLSRYRDHRSLAVLFELTAPAVLLSCFTTIVGFASIAMVRHRGLAGFGLIMLAGTALSLVIAVIWIPSVIRIFYGNPACAKN